MKRNAIMVSATLILLLLAGSQRAVHAQSEELQKLEIGVHFTSLSLNKDFYTDTEPGVGGRFTYNLTRSLAIEAEGNLFPADKPPGFRDGGRSVQGLFGVKLGKRYKRFGIFGKARPGFLSFSKALLQIFPSSLPIDANTQVITRSERLTHFAFDIGGVLEFYPSRRFFTRIDAGDTIIRLGDTRFDAVSIIGNQLFPTPVTIPGANINNFQFSAGVGFRF